MRDVTMPEVRGQHRQFPCDVAAGAIPLDERSRRKRVATILQPRPAPDTASSGGAQSHSAGEVRERAPRRAARQRPAPVGHEERVSLTMCMAHLPSPGISGQSGTGRLTEWDEARLAELRVPDEQDPALEIDIG